MLKLSYARRHGYERKSASSFPVAEMETKLCQEPYGFVDGDGKCELKRDLGTTCLHPITASLTFSSQFQLKGTDILSMHVW